VGLVQTALEAHDLYRFYHAGDDETLALRGVSLSVRRGEVVAVMGPSGSGKSTLVNCLAGLDEPDGGWVAVAGKRITRRPKAEQSALRARLIGLLLQSGNMLDHLTIGDNLRADMHFGAMKRDGDLVEKALADVGLPGRRGSFPDQLSGGELARASLALALINDPAVLIVDEPTGEVDDENERIVLELMRERARKGGAVLVVTHSPVVASVADRVLHLVDGRLASG
jgi:putative ABC transport system ATP-binding protein